MVPSQPAIQTLADPSEAESGNPFGLTKVTIGYILG